MQSKFLTQICIRIRRCNGSTFNFQHRFLGRNSRGNLSLYLTYISDDVVLCDKRLLLERGTSIYFKITQLIADANVSPVLRKFKEQVI